MAKKVREPVQVYLETADRDLLAQVARVTGLPKAEVLRRGLRQFASSALAETAPGSALEGLIGALDGDDSLPTDLSVRHDEYLYGGRRAGTD